MKYKLTAQEKKWVLYDVGNSAFILLVTTIVPIYFNALATGGGLDSVQYLAYWGYAASAATLLVALTGPVLGSISDWQGRKKPMFLAAALLGICGCVLLGFVGRWFSFLCVFVLAKLGYSLSLIFYDSMLADVTEPERMDSVSSHGYAWGYIGSCVPFLLCLGLVLGAGVLGISMSTGMMLAFLVTALWWLLCTQPLLRCYRQRNYVSGQVRPFSQLWRTLKDIAGDRQVFLFILAFFFYIDGVYTIIDMATAYGTALGFDTTGLLLALLVTQIVAFPSSLMIGRLSRTVDTGRLISVCVLAYFGIAVFAMFMSTQAHFWILAVVVGMFQGGVQALSRSHFAKIIPAEKSGEYFGLLDICGKGASMLGTFTVSLISQLSGSTSLGVGAIALFFLVGLFLFRSSLKRRG
ncbi:MAG: MFS transporter [Candidatus Limivicinus sp.]